MDWNFYINIDARNQITSYDGYRDTNLILNQNGWEFVPKKGSSEFFVGKLLQTEFSNDYPIGRKDWFVNDVKCNLKSENRSLTFSMCDIVSEFTCNSGQCIDVNKRCNEENDCNDGSDEDVCDLVQIPKSYKDENAPRSTNTPNPNTEMRIQINILNIDFIDTIKMAVGLTLEIYLKWFDERLKFSNPNINEENLIPTKEAQKLWLPLDNLIHT